MWCVCLFVCVLTYTHTMEYYLAIKSEILPFAATWMDRENIILSEVRQSQISDNITYIWNLKNNTSKLIYKTDPWTKKTNL